MERNISKIENSNGSSLPQEKKTLVNGIQALSNGLSEKQGETMSKIDKSVYGLQKKSLFSESARQEIEIAGFSEADKLTLQTLKLRRLLEYKKNMEIVRSKMYQRLINGLSPETKTSNMFNNESKFLHSAEDNDILKDFFQHYEHCSHNASCNFQNCPEISEMLTCWEKCKETKNVNCVLCGETVQIDLFMKEKAELDKNRFTETRKKVCDSITNYHGLKAVKLGNNLHKKSLFSAIPNHDLRNKDFSDKEKEVIKLTKLLRVLHSKYCASKWNSQICTFPDCDLLYGVLDHVSDCTNELSCNFENCFEVKELLSHWFRCRKVKDFKCQLCGDYMSKYYDLQKEIIQIQKEKKRVISDFKKRRDFFMINCRRAENAEKFLDFFSNW